MLQNLDPEDFIKKAKQIEIKKRRRTLIVTSVIVFLAILFLLYTVLSVNESNSEKEKAIKDNKSLTEIKDSAYKAILKQDSLISIVTKYFGFRNEHKADSAESLYADTVISYFKNLKNISKATITASDKQYWAKYKADNFLITDPIQIILNYAGDRAIVKGRQCFDEQKCFDEFVEIHFEANKKINYVRAFFDKN